MIVACQTIFLIIDLKYRLWFICGGTKNPMEHKSTKIDRVYSEQRTSLFETITSQVLFIPFPRKICTNISQPHRVKGGNGHRWATKYCCFCPSIRKSFTFSLDSAWKSRKWTSFFGVVLKPFNIKKSHLDTIGKVLISYF